MDDLPIPRSDQISIHIQPSTMASNQEGARVPGEEKRFQEHTASAVAADGD